MTNKPRNGWVTGAWIIALLQAAITGAMLIYLANDSYTEEHGWGGWTINPWSLIDVAILLIGVIGILMKRAGFALMLAIYAWINLALAIFVQWNNTSTRIAFGLVYLLVYYNAYRQLKSNFVSTEILPEVKQDTDKPPSKPC